MRAGCDNMAKINQDNQDIIMKTVVKMWINGDDDDHSEDRGEEMDTGDDGDYNEERREDVVIRGR